MSTFMLKDNKPKYTPISNVFIEKYMPSARGEFVKVYLLLLKINNCNEPGANGQIIASTLSLLESDVLNALHYWNDLGVIRLTPIDKMNNYSVELLPLDDIPSEKNKDVNLVDTLLNDSEKTIMFKDIEKTVARPLSAKEMEMYLSWQKDFSFSSELIMLLIEYCASKGKNDYRYIEKVALSWHDQNIRSVEDAQNHIKKAEEKWKKYRRILNYIGIKNTDIMKPQEDMLNKWLYTYKFDVTLIEKACDICSERLNRADFKYIDGILSKWYKDNIKTLEDVALKDKPPKTNYSKFKNNNSNNKSASNYGFNNFEGRSYDYNSLERKLLGRDTDD